MAKDRLGQSSVGRYLITGLMGLGLFWTIGCAREQPKSSGATMVPEQVRSHADKAFEKLKQEDQHRAVSPATGP